MNNAGYKIIKREFYSENFAIVIGYKENGSSKYVTWEYSKDNDNYFWGHYFNSKSEVMRDYHERLMIQYEYQGKIII